MPCLIPFERGDEQQSVVLSVRLEIDSWTKPEEPDHLVVRTSPGEYLQPLFLKDGSLAVVSPIQEPRANRLRFYFLEIQHEVTVCFGTAPLFAQATGTPTS